MHMFDNWIDQQHLKNYPFNFLGDFDKDHQMFILNGKTMTGNSI